MKSEKPKRGGYRPGSGRKPAGTVALNLNVKPKTRDAVKKRAKANGQTPGQLLDQIAESLLDE